MQFDFALVLAFATAAVGFGVVNLTVGRFLRPTVPSAEKDLVYECGEKPIGEGWFNFNPRFYVVALIFVVFEVEIALTLPVAMVFRKWVLNGQGWGALGSLVLFLGILAGGLVWVWSRRDLEWVRGERP